MKITWRTWLVGFGVLMLCVLSGVIGSVSATKFASSATELTYVDFISTMLTSISLLLTLLAFFIAILSVIGWNAISRGVSGRVETLVKDGFAEGQSLHQIMTTESRSAAEQSIKSFIEKEFNEGGVLAEKFEKEAREAIFSGIDPVNREEIVEGEDDE